MSIALVTIGMTSCGKSSKGKMANEWQVESYTESQSGTNSDGSSYSSSSSLTETTVSNTYSYTQSGNTLTSSTDGTVQTHTFTIEKDGTWKWIKNMTYEPGPNEMTVQNELSGSWSFVGKNKEDGFKKNERILFNVLSSKSTTVQTSVQEEQIENNTYLAGERVMIFTITESKGKEATLEMDINNTSDGTNGPSTNNTKITMNLKSK